MKTVRGELLRQPVFAGREIQNRVRRIGGCSKKKWQQHHTGFLLAAPPGSIEQYADHGAESNLGCDRKNFIHLLEGRHGHDGQQKHGNLQDAHGPSLLGGREAKHKFESDGHEDAAHPGIKHAVYVNGHRGQAECHVGRSAGSDRKA